MNNEHSNVLRLVTVNAYIMDKMLDIMRHSEVTSKTGPHIWEALDSAHLSLSGSKSRTTAITTATIITMKEKLKSLRANVHILTLTATPIPRTLNMALSGIRDLSLIVTPPAKRLSVKTFIREQQDSLVKEAVSRELLRGGQVFYLHNEVKTIDHASQHLQEIIPGCSIVRPL